jgi:hypothetical protein
MATAACNTRQLEGVLRGTGFTITIAGEGATAFRGLVQSFSMQFIRPMNRIYDLTSSSFYYIEAPPQGTLNLNKVVGPMGAPKIFCTCSPLTITLNSTMSCSPGTAPIIYRLMNVFPVGLAGQGTSENMIIMMGVTFTFTDLGYDQG